MKPQLIILSLLLCLGAVHADGAEQRLLRSWGMAIDGDGKLHLAHPPSSAEEGSRWSPDLSAYQGDTGEKPELQIDPVRLNPAANAAASD